MVMVKHHKDGGKNDGSDEDIQTMTSVIVKLTLTDNLVKYHWTSPKKCPTKWSFSGTRHDIRLPKTLAIKWYC